MKRVDIGIGAALWLLMAACSPAASSPADDQAKEGSARTAVQPAIEAKAPPVAKEEGAALTTSTAESDPNVISEDREGVAADRVTIAKKAGASSGTGCDIHLSYAKAGPKVAQWAVAPCVDVDAEISTQAQLIEMGHWEDLPIDAVSDIKRYNKGGFLWVESGPTASIFILDGVMRLREVPVAD